MSPGTPRGLGAAPGARRRRSSRYAAPVTTWRLIPDDGARDPAANLALEEALARHVAADPTAPTPLLRLWRSSPCVVVGRFQLAAAEVDTAAARDLDAPILRRFTGGGTVWHDPGNLNVTVVVRPEDAVLGATPGLRSLPGIYRLVLDPLAAAVRALGVPEAAASDRDVATPHGKLSGVAAWLGGRALLVHATLLVDADLDALRRACAGPGAPGHPRWERTRSRRATVTSVAVELARSGRPVPDAAAVDAAVTAAFGADAIDAAVLSDAERTAAAGLLAGRYRDPAWNADPPGDEGP